MVSTAAMLQQRVHRLEGGAGIRRGDRRERVLRRMRQPIDAVGRKHLHHVGRDAGEAAAARLQLVGAQDGALERVDLDGHVGQPAHHFLFAAQALAVFLGGQSERPQREPLRARQQAAFR